MASRRADKLYDWLSQLPAPDAELILAAGLERAEPAYFDRIVALLFERGSDAAWAALIASYPQLGPDVRARLHADAQQMRSGLVRVLRGGSPQGRCNALQALTENPEPALAYLLPDLLRASSGDVRRTAAVTLRCLANVVIERAEQARVDPAQANGLAPQTAPLEAARQSEDRAAVARAVWEALRSFDLHYRLEVAETALWFAGDIGRDLWKMLANRRSPTAHVVSANLNSWDSPRLARFLLEGLAQPAWRAAVREQLMRWRGPERLAAVLRNSDLLARPEFREGLGSLKRPPWFVGLNDLRDLAPELRARAPEWLLLLGFRSEEMRALLADWSETAFVELRAAADIVVPGDPARASADSREPDAQRLAEQNRPAPQHQPLPHATAEAGRDQKSPAPPLPAADQLAEQRVAAVREQARRALQELAESGPEKAAVDQIAELEKTLRRLRSELSPPSPLPLEWENPP